MIYDFIIYLLAIFFQNLIFGIIKGEIKGQKIAQNDKKLCLPYSISQERYIMWLWFVLQICEMISQANFFIIQNFDFWCFLGGLRAKNDVKLSISVCFTLYLWNCRSCLKLFKIFIFQWPTSTVFSIIDCFASSSINTKKKFWDVPHILHMRAIFFI